MIEEDAIDKVIDEFDSWMWAGDWDACNRAMDEADVDTLLMSVLLAILTMTACEKTRLANSRTALYRRVRAKLIVRDGEDEATNTLRGLEP